MKRFASRAVPALLLLCAASLNAQTFPGGAQLISQAIDSYDQMFASQTDGILASPSVDDADKEKIRAFLKTARENLAKVKEETKTATAGGQIDNKAAQDLMTKAQNASTDLNQFLRDRPDLGFVSMRTLMMREWEGRSLTDNVDEYRAALKQAVADEKILAKANALVDQFAKDYADFQKKMMAIPPGDINAQMAAGKEMTPKVLACLDSIHALLTSDQRADLEWALIKQMPDRGEEPIFMILGFSTQPGTIRIPEDGAYVLIATDLKNSPVPTPANTLATVTLKKGDQVAFKKTDKGIVATAGDKSYDIPADKTGVWQIARKMP